MPQFVLKYRRLWISLVLLVGLVMGVTQPIAGQAPFSAQIQAALRSFLAGNQTVSGTWTFSTPPVGGGAPTNATYITQTANSSLSAEQALGALATGLLNVTTTTGVVSSFVPTDDNLLVGSGTVWALKALSSCSAGSSALTYNTTTNAFGCNTISATPASPANSIQFNNAGVFGGSANLTWNGSLLTVLGSGLVGVAEASLPPLLQGYVAAPLLVTRTNGTGAAIGIESVSTIGVYLAQQGTTGLFLSPPTGFAVDLYAGESYSGSMRGFAAYTDANTFAADVAIGFYAYPHGNGGGGTTTTYAGFWSAAQGGRATNAYGLWLDEQGVFRIKADNTFNSVYQAIPALYNPQFTKYTPGATDYERVVLQWESNVATLTTEAGVGAAALRALNLGDSGVQIQVNGNNLTLSGNLVTTGAFNPTFAIPSSSTWTFPSGGGNLLVSGGTLTGRFVASGSTPAVTNTTANSCGTTAATIAGNDNAFKVTVGATAGTSCTVTFATAFSNAPSCTVSNETTANLSRATSTTSTVILAGTFVAGDVLAGTCLGR